MVKGKQPDDRQARRRKAKAEMTEEQKRAKKIADLNDQLRRNLMNGRYGKTVMTVGITSLKQWQYVSIIQAIMSFGARFTKDNDPHGEHDFGKIDLPATPDVFWKIDYYERGSDYTVGAEDPTNPRTTDRVLTIMLAEEY